MAKPWKITDKLVSWFEKRTQAIWANLMTNHLWQRMLKNILATTISIILGFIPAVVAVIGRAAYLAPIVTVFGHPGRRFGAMAEALILTLSGSLLGVAWSMFGIYLSSLVYADNTPAAYTIKGVFFAIALLFHGSLRSHTPRLFILALLFIIVSVVSFTGVSVTVSKLQATQILYPILMAVVIILLVNVTVFPEFSSSFLGITTIETLGETIGVLRDACEYFVSIADIEKDAEAEQPALSTEPQLENAISRKRTTLAEKTEPGPDSSPFKNIVAFFRQRSSKDEAAKTEPTAEPQSKTRKLQALTSSKAKLRAQLANCSAAQTECNFELTWAVLSPQDLKPISSISMKILVANVVAMIGACESKYALMGDSDDSTNAKNKESDDLDQILEESKDEVEESQSKSQTATKDLDHESDSRRSPKTEEKKRNKGKKSKQRAKTEQEANMDHIALVKPRKEIEFGDTELLKYLVGRIAKPLADLQEKIDRSVDVIACCMAYCYDVPKLPSGAPPPDGIELDEIDIRVDILKAALTTFDADSAQALEGAVKLHDMHHSQFDVAPRMETFLISSFLLNFRQSAIHTVEMLGQSRVIVEKRQQRNGRRTLYAPAINWRKWLKSGGEKDAFSLPEQARKDARMGKKDDDAADDSSSATSLKPSVKGHKDDLESASPLHDEPTASTEPRKPPQRYKSTTLRLRNKAADALEYFVGSDDFLYAVKLTIAVFLVTWPAFIEDWNKWYFLNRGLWAALQLILITEVALGTSIMTFVLRAFGTTIGCLWGLVAYEAGNGNRIVCMVILIIGIIPSAYLQLGSQYVKVGMVSIISMSVVALATIDQTVPGSATENFLKRFIAFLIGGVVALLVEFFLFPVKARDRLVESLASSISQISDMEACLAYGIETEVNVDVHSKKVMDRFKRAKAKAEGALTAAETFLPFCTHEPRLKGSFEGISLIYAEILYVLHAVVDRMENMLHLRQEYGSGVLEELNAQVFPYRRNVAGSITLILFAVHTALTTKIPLPQFLPSARLAHLRMVNRVRKAVLTRGATEVSNSEEKGKSETEIQMLRRVLRHKFLSWNAASAGQIEVIEYLEELIDLVKLLVGASEFRSGLLLRPRYQEYVERINRGEGMHKPPSENIQLGKEKEKNETGTKPEGHGTGLIRRRRASSKTESGREVKQQTTNEGRKTDEEELPRSLQRVRSRRVEEMNIVKLEKSRSKDTAETLNGKNATKPL
ncbi:hypothetical protein BJ878DRAFT_484482 [Calycina marina]|uniref:ER transporter 6TM N-terminal domain-containing protein n=1 Tax=Calycina marina TaxID=1763456 RepID=A0A9P7ZBQ3_9HELO|nr:hypothetical protein BJ878DRAFT_484482 [Calycina marina]